MTPGEFITRMLVLFGEPDTGDTKAFLAEYARLLKGEEPSLIQATSDLISKTRTWRSWPTLGEVRDAMHKAAVTQSLGSVRNDDKLHKDWTSESVAKAYDLLRSDIGRRAADGGWVLSLWDFCRKRGRLPQVFEIDKIKASAAGFDSAYAGLKPDTTMSASLIKLGDTMRTRRDRLARHAWGEDVGREDFSAPATTDVTKRMTGEHRE